MTNTSHDYQQRNFSMGSRESGRENATLAPSARPESLGESPGRQSGVISQVQGMKNVGDAERAVASSSYTGGAGLARFQGA